MTKPVETCLLMFSGGRDSTLSAISLSKRFGHLILVTVMSEHLVGIERVVRRISQLRALLPGDTEWMRIAMPPPPAHETLQYPTCLSCQRGYVSAAVAIAKQRRLRDIAMGYSGYQNSWPEQTPYATSRLRSLLGDLGIHLHLPAYHILSKEEAMDELLRSGLPTESFEQKCLRQGDNVEIGGEILRAEIDRWISGIADATAASDRTELKVLAHEPLSRSTSGGCIDG